MNTLSGVLIILGFGPYIWATWTGQQPPPSPVTWAIWASVDSLILVAMINKKAKSKGQLAGSVAGAWTTAVLAVFMGMPTMGSIEWISIVGAAVGIALWQIKDDANIAIVCASAALLAGGLPTVAKLYADPFAEDPIAWTLWTISCVCAFKAVRKWDLANALQPVIFTIIDATMYFLVVVRPLWFI